MHACLLDVYVHGSLFVFWDSFFFEGFSIWSSLWLGFLRAAFSVGLGYSGSFLQFSFVLFSRCSFIGWVCHMFSFVLFMSCGSFFFSLAEFVSLGISPFLFIQWQVDSSLKKGGFAIIFCTRNKFLNEKLQKCYKTKRYRFFLYH